MALLSKIKSIDSAHRKALAKLRILTTDDLVTSCYLPDDLEELTQRVKIPNEKLAEYLILCDLLRVKGMSINLAELLAVSSEIQSVSDLAKLTPINFKSLIVRTNNQIGILNKIPSSDRLASIIISAGELKNRVINGISGKKFEHQLKSLRSRTSRFDNKGWVVVSFGFVIMLLVTAINAYPIYYELHEEIIRQDGNIILSKLAERNVIVFDHILVFSICIASLLCVVALILVLLWERVAFRFVRQIPLLLKIPSERGLYIDLIHSGILRRNQNVWSAVALTIVASVLITFFPSKASLIGYLFFPCLIVIWFSPYLLNWRRINILAKDNDYSAFFRVTQLIYLQTAIQLILLLVVVKALFLSFELESRVRNVVVTHLSDSLQDWKSDFSSLEVQTGSEKTLMTYILNNHDKFVVESQKTLINIIDESRAQWDKETLMFAWESILWAALITIAVVVIVPLLAFNPARTIIFIGTFLFSWMIDNIIGKEISTILVLPRESTLLIFFFIFIALGNKFLMDRMEEWLTSKTRHL